MGMSVWAPTLGAGVSVDQAHVTTVMNQVHVSGPFQDAPAPSCPQVPATPTFTPQLILVCVSP